MWVEKDTKAKEVNRSLSPFSEFPITTNIFITHGTSELTLKRELEL